MRDIYRALRTFEADFVKVHKVCINEAMLLAALSGEEKLSAAELATGGEMTPSHTSKVLRSLEEKGLVERLLGREDRRKMYFALTPSGREALAQMKCGSVSVPELLEPIFRNRCGGCSGEK